jgi:hypothetical protein
MSTEPATAGDGVTYSYRPSLMGAPWQFRLTGSGLEWTAGRHSGRIAYDKIRRVRMSYRPTNLQQQRFMTEIWANGVPKLKIVSCSWKSMFEQERFDRPYIEFVAALHHRMIEAGAPAEYQQGTDPLIFWPGFAVFTGVTLGMLWLVVRALQDAAFSGAFFIAAFVALFAWRGSNYLNRNRPGVYRPDALPALLLPKP